jgi:hypothetical protein
MLQMIALAEQSQHMSPDQEEKMKFKIICLGLLLGLCLSAGVIQGQESRAVITGTVSDPQGKVIPGATVQVKNLATNVITTVATSERGLYTVPPVNPGNYSVTVSAPGFKTSVQGNIELRVSDRKTVDVKLELGSPTETVTVSAEAILIDTSSASIGTTIGKEAISNLPLMGRNPFSLVQYAAGIRYETGAASGGQRPFDNGGMDSININGGGNRNNEILLDGVTNTNNADMGAGGGYISFVPPPDAVSEFKVSSNMYDSEYGHTAGGVVSVNLKSGTNAYHGAAYWYVRNDALNANNTSANAAGTPLSAMRWNQPGFQVEGPVRIPWLYNGSDKTFFMYSWERIRSSTPRVSNMTVPTALERTGDFSQTFVSGTSGACVQIYDPLTTVQTSPGVYSRTAFSGCKIPANRLNPIALKFMTYYPLPKITGVARGVTNLTVAPNPTTDAYDAHTIRVDQNINSKNRFFATFVRNNRHEDGGLGGGRSAFIEMGNPNAAPTYLHWRTNTGANMNLTTTISPTFINTARAAWNLHEFAVVPYAMGFDPATIGFPSSYTDQAQFKTFPGLSIGGYQSLGWSGPGTGNNFSHTFSIGDTMVKVMSAHSLKWGFEGRFMPTNMGPLTASASLSASNNYTRANPLVSNSSSGDGLASFLLGYPSGVSSQWRNQPARGQYYYGLFVQDDWRLARNITLSMGLRWDYESPVTDRWDRQIVGFDPSAPYTIGTTAVKGGVIFADGDHRFAFKRDLNNFQPRLGIAYQIRPKMVLRGGWGISYVSAAGDIPPTTGYDLTTSPGISEGDAGIVPILVNGLGMLSNPFPTGIMQPYGNSRGVATNAGGSISYYWPDRSIPYTHSFSAGFQYELPFRTVVDLEYVASRARQLSTSKEINGITYAQYMSNGSKLTGTVTNPFAGYLPGTQMNGATITLEQSLRPYIQYQGITQSGRTIGTSRYDSFQLRVEKRFSKGLTYSFNATFAKGSTYNTYLNGSMDDFGQFISRIDGTPPTSLNMQGTYLMPFFSKSGALVKGLLGGWMVAGTGFWYSGGMLSVGGANPTGINPKLENGTPAHWFNTCTYNDNTGLRQNCTSTTEPIAWIITKPYTLLTYPVPQFTNWRNPNQLIQVNLSIFKAFSLKERAKLEIRAEFLNAFNTPINNYANTTATSSTFGQRTSISQSNDPRQIQVSMRLTF